MIPFVAIGPAGSSGGVLPPAGDINNKLSIAYAGDWQLVDGVEDVGYVFGPQRAFSGAPPNAPSNGVKVRRANPDKSDLIQATSMGVGLESTDLVFTLWATTLRSSDGSLIEPARADFLSVDDGLYRILSLRRTVDYAQYRLMCRRSAKEP